MSKRTNAIYGFQGLRGFAILLIVISHCNFGVNSYGNQFLGYAGAWGVSFFIMLSGFLAVYKSENDCISFRDSLRLIKHKFIKCFPLHIVTFIIAVPLFFTQIVSEPLKMGEIAAVNLSLTQTLFPFKSVYFSYNAVSWYLSLDIIIVLFLPIVMRLISGRMGAKRLLKFACIVLIIQTVIAISTQNIGISHWITYIFPGTRMLEYIVGGGIAKLVKNRNTIGLKNAKLLTCVGLLSGCLFLMLSLNSNNSLFLSMVWTVPVSMVVLGIYYQEEEKQSLFKNRWLIFIGDISFELFLTHQLFIKYIVAIFGKLDINIYWWSYFIIILFSIVIAYICQIILKKIRRI